MTIKVVVSDNAEMPERKSEGAAGYDLCCTHDFTVAAKCNTVILTGISIAIPNNFFGKVCSRSGLSFKHNIEVGAGIIDSDYRGEIKVLLYNHGDSDFEAEKGTRIAQLIFIPCMTPRLLAVTSLDTTERGNNGFGSTDK